MPPNLGEGIEILQALLADIFCGLFSKLIVTTDMKVKHVLASKDRVYNQELIYGYGIGQLASSREFNIDDKLACKLHMYHRC